MLYNLHFLDLKFPKLLQLDNLKDISDTKKRKTNLLQWSNLKDSLCNFAYKIESC